MTEVAITKEELAKPLNPTEVTIEAWYIDDSSEDCRLPHKQVPNKPCSAQVLKDLGVVCWKLDADKYETDAKLQAIRDIRGYNYQDIVNINETMPNYEQKLAIFFEEHIHQDEEIRYILDGSGYFDVRDFDDKWIRIDCRKGDLIVLPAGIYHRFTLDSNDYIKAMRLFIGEPVWTPHNRPQENNPYRQEYLKKFHKAITA